MSSLSLRSHWEDWELRTSSLSRLSFRLEEDGVQPESGGAPGSGGFWFCAECRWDRNPRHRRVRARWNNSAAHHVFTALRLRFSPQLKVWFPHPFLAKVEPRLLPLPQILLHTCLSTLPVSPPRGARHSAPRLWNSPPPRLRNVGSFPSFQTQFPFISVRIFWMRICVYVLESGDRPLRVRFLVHIIPCVLSVRRPCVQPSVFY